MERGPSVLRGSRSTGVSRSGTAELNPTATAGRINPRINNGETEHLWLRTKPCPDRITNESSSPSDHSFPSKLCLLFLRAATCQFSYF